MLTPLKEGGKQTERGFSRLAKRNYNSKREKVRAERRPEGKKEDDLVFLNDKAHPTPE